MRILGNAKIKTRLIVGFSVVSLLAVVVGVLGLGGMGRVAGEGLAGARNKHMAVEHLLDINHRIMDGRIHVLQARLDPTPQVMAKEAEKVEEYVRGIGKGLGALKALDLAPAERAGVKQLTSAMSPYVESGLKPMAVALRAGDIGDVKRIAAEVTPPIYDRVKTARNDLVKALSENGTQEFLQAQSSYRTIRAVTIAVLLAGVIFAGFVFLTVVRGVGTAVSSLERAAQRVASGDLTARTEYGGSDELGRVAASFDRVAEAFHSVVGGIRSSSDQVASASTGIASATKQIADGTDAQVQQTSQVAAAMEEMSATVIEVAKNASQAAESVRQASSTAREGGEVVQRTIDGMRRISEAVHGSAETIQKLGENSDKIGEIVAVIEDIADQTNLLALNAAIEAARAGEQGRGFAVVADEVRKLAERTTKATREISEMIAAIQRDTGSAVKAMESGTREVTRGMDEADQAGAALKRIVEMVGQANDMVAQIATAAEEQSAASEEITGSVERIASAGKEVASGARQTETASGDMAGIVSQLREMVGRFHVNGAGQSLVIGNSSMVNRQ